MVPSSKGTVTPLAATRWPMRPLNALEPLRLKSPSSPWPTASCSRMPGQPAPSTTVISPPGRAGFRLVRACVHRLVRMLLICASSKYARPKRPPPPAEPTSRRPFCSAITVIDRRTRGAHRRQRAVGANPPAPRRIRWPGPPSPARRGVAQRAGALLQALQQATLAVLSSEQWGPRPGKGCGWWQSFWGYAHTASLRHGRNGSHGARGIQQTSEMSSRYAKRSFAAHGAHAHALVNAEGAGLHGNCPLPGSSLAARVLEVQVGIDPPGGHGFPPAHGPGGSRPGQRRQQQFTGDIDALGGGCAVALR